MDSLHQLIATYGLWFVFLTVLLDQGGVPLPAWPAVAAASAVTVEAASPVWPILLAATAAALVADCAWYLGGRRFGGRLVRLICRLSLSPDSCVASTGTLYARWGAPSLVLAKFIPGVAAIGTTMAGQFRTPLPRFVLFDGIGALLWTSVPVVLGVVFHDALSEALALLASYGRIGLAVLAGALAMFVAWKLVRRHLLLRQLRMSRITVPELRALHDSGMAVTVIDARPAELRMVTGWIPGSHGLDEVQSVLSPNDPVVVYCDCPDEISAVRVCRDLHRRGIRGARPLLGGLQAWSSEGLPLAELAHAGVARTSPQ